MKMQVWLYYRLHGVCHNIVMISTQKLYTDNSEMRSRIYLSCVSKDMYQFKTKTMTENCSICPIMLRYLLPIIS